MSSTKTRRFRNRGGETNHPGKIFESNGPAVRMRGTALQIQERYESLADEASSSGDSVLAESHLQFAEHYARVHAASQAIDSHHA